MADEPLNGYVFVFTGEMKMDRDEAKGRVLLLGARVTTSVSSKTTHLVTGQEPGPSKLEKAKESGTKILNEEEFMELLNKNSGKMNKVISTDIKDSKNTTENKERDHKNENSTDKKGKNSAAWVEKYRPTIPEEILGNHGLLEQLTSYLKGETEFKAVLLSGAPGVGKTTAALAACRILGFTPIEFNASDLRNKKSIVEKISNFTSGLSINKNNTKVMIMDEVDGMTSDRGGLPELINIIKKSKIPIICICNDKSHPKMRTLTNHCLDLHFRKLDIRTIIPRIKYILQSEGKTVPDGIINEIAVNSSGDMRYILNTLQNLVSKGQLSLDYVNKSLVKKNILKSTFEIAAELFQKRSISEKIDLYFEDYSMMPLFIHENYVKCNFRDLKEFLYSSEAISYSDIIDARIHGSEQEWSMMPYHALFSVVIPLKDKTLQKRLDFPAYLGQNSKKQKNIRILNEVCRHLKCKLTSKTFRFVGCEILYRKFMSNFIAGNINDCLKIIVDLDLLKDDILSIGEVTGMDLIKEVSAKNKALLTREYKKIVRALPYSVVNITEVVEEEE